MTTYETIRVAVKIRAIGHAQVMKIMYHGYVDPTIALGAEEQIMNTDIYIYI